MSNQDQSPARGDDTYIEPPHVGITLSVLTTLPRWVVWRPELKGSRVTKVPKSPKTLGDAASTRSHDWGTYAEAEAADKRLPPSKHGPGGIGLILGDHLSKAIGGVDLDACRDPTTGIIEPWARDVLDRLATYAEVSPSGTGIKAFFLMEPLAVEALRAAHLLDPDGFGRSFKRGTGTDHPPAIEVHLGGRYYAVTDQHVPEYPSELQPVRTATLRTILGDVGPAFKGNGGSAKLDRSARAFGLAAEMKGQGATFQDYCAVLASDPELAAWKTQKGEANDSRELKRVWARAGNGQPETVVWSEPDMSILRLNPVPAPSLPLQCLGDRWADWVEATARAAACPPDYVAAPLLASVSTLVGNARWGHIFDWSEPPHLWVGVIGHSGDGKTPGAKRLLSEVIPEIERRMGANHPDRVQRWKTDVEASKAAREIWEGKVKAAQKGGHAPPMPPAEPPSEPMAPMVKLNDVTVERVARLLADAADKGLMVTRDELAGWFLGLNAYHDAGRPFWLEAWNGGPFRVERVKHPAIMVPRLAVAVYGGVQPDRLTELAQGPDDGLMSRFLWFWPAPIPFRLGERAAGGWEIEALDKLRRLEMQPGRDDGPAVPRMVPLAPEAYADMERFGQDMQRRAHEAGGLLASAFGKARGQALRLGVVLEFLWWCSAEGNLSEPVQISRQAFLAAVTLMDEYFIPNAERVYGGEGQTKTDRSATRLSRWIVNEGANEVHVRNLQRDVRLPDLTTAEAIKSACSALIDAGWLAEPEKGNAFGQRGKVAYPVNPRVHHGPVV
jgi:hypothetical protein